MQTHTHPQLCFHHLGGPTYIQFLETSPHPNSPSTSYQVFTLKRKYNLWSGGERRVPTMRLCKAELRLHPTCHVGREPHKHTNYSDQRAEECSARKQVDGQTGLPEALWCLYRELVLEICFTYSDSTSARLWMGGRWIFQKLEGAGHTTVCRFKGRFLGSGLGPKQ